MFKQCVELPDFHLQGTDFQDTTYRTPILKPGINTYLLDIFSGCLPVSISPGTLQRLTLNSKY